MWIKVIDGERTAWLPGESCRNSAGLTCTAMVELCEPPPVPDWLRPPRASLLRDRLSLGGLGGASFEYWSVTASLDELLNHYKDGARAGGLTVKPWPDAPAGRSGLSADGEDYWLRLNAFAHGGRVFWTLDHAAKASPQQPSRRPYMVRLVEIVNGTAHMVNELTGETYTAAVDALTDVEPVVVRHPQPEERTIAWSSLPDWAQFAVKSARLDAHGVARLREGGEWWAVREGSFRGGQDAVFRRCLAWLDEHGFDGGGEQRPERSYSVSLLQGGASLNLRACSEAGDSLSLTVLNTLGVVKTVHMNYHAPPGAVVPPAL